MAKRRTPAPVPVVEKVERLTCAVCGMTAPKNMMRAAPEPSLVRCVNQVACRKRARSKQLLRGQAKQAVRRQRGKS